MKASERKWPDGAIAEMRRGVETEQGVLARRTDHYTCAKSNGEPSWGRTVRPAGRRVDGLVEDGVGMSNIFASKWLAS